MPYGWAYPYPESYGGAPSDIELIWLAMRAMVGGDIGVGPVDGFEDSARQQDAIVMAQCERAVERAFFSAFPRIAEDALPLWQKLLGAQAMDELDLRELLNEAWKAPNGATSPNLEEALQVLSPQLSIVVEPDSASTVPGKIWAPLDNVPDYGPRPAATLPAWTSSDVLRVVYTLDDDAGEVAIPEAVERDVSRLLQRRLPANQTWTLTTYSASGSAGVFLLDGGDHGESVLGLTPFG